MYFMIIEQHLIYRLSYEFEHSNKIFARLYMDTIVLNM